MARENQGLQIGLIVCVMFTIIFGVLAFVFYRSYTDQFAKADAAAKSESETKSKLSKAEDEISKYKGYIGASTTEQFDAITTQFAKEMEAYLGKDAPAGVTAVPQADRSYRKAVQYLADALLDRSSRLKAEEDANKALNAKFAEREKLSQAQIKQNADAAKQASDELEKTRNEYNQARANIEKQQNDLLARVQTAEKAKADIQAQAAAQVAAGQQELAKAKGLIEAKQQQIENFQKPTFEVADGKIEWVNQRQKAAWINVGQADHLNRLITFSVYDSTVGDVAVAKPKAKIEVTQLLGPHLAEVRIVEETEAGNPILPGDLIHTPLWQPGQQKHFALVGFIDIDKDGKSDLQKLMQLIQMSGGVVDVYYDDTGKIHPEVAKAEDVSKLVTDRTNAVILGAAPTEASRTDSLKAYQEIMKAAGRYAIKSIPLADFLDQVGYRPDDKVINYGAGADPNQFRPRAPEGAQKKSTGNVFQPRKPPKTSPAATLKEEPAKPSATKEKQP